MGSVKGIILALATVFVEAECFLPLAIRREIIPLSDETLSSCGERIDRCGNLFGSQAFNVALVNLQFLVDDIDGYCQTYRQLADCVRPLTNECFSWNPAMVEDLLVHREYICSDRGQSLLRESTDSVCFSDPSQRNVVNELTDDCIVSRRDSVQDGNLTRCQNVNITVECIVQATTQQCGQALGDFVRELTDVDRIFWRCDDE